MTAGEVFSKRPLPIRLPQKGALFRMDSGYLLGIGPHTAEAATELAHKLHPDLHCDGNHHGAMEKLWARVSSTLS